MGEHKGIRHWKRRLPTRLVNVTGACGLWALIGWWSLTGGDVVGFWVGHERKSWLPSLLFLGMIALVWACGNAVMVRGLRELPRLLYYWHVETWKLLTIDVIAGPVARYSTMAMTVMLLNLALQQAPDTSHFQFHHHPFAVESGEPVNVDAQTLADLFCPLSRKILRAMAATLTARTLFTLRTPPNARGSVAFRLVPLQLRSGKQPGKPASLKEWPLLRLRRDDKPYVMPLAVIEADGIPVWRFQSPIVIDEYRWSTPERGDPENDFVLWRLEGQPTPNSTRWKLIHECTHAVPDLVPLERDQKIRRKFIAPDGSVAQSEQSWIGIYYRTLQNPQEDRDRYALSLLLRRILLPVIFLMGVGPWMPVFGLEMRSVLGLTSLTGVAAGAALSLAKSEVLENLFAGTLLSAQGSIISGDAIEIRYQVGNSQQSVSGVVMAVGSAYVFLRDQEGAILQVPNRKVLGAVIRTSTHPDDFSSSPTLRPRGGTALNYLSRESSGMLPCEED